MLKKLDKKNFEKFADWAYKIALDRTRSCYPTYSDGVKTKNDFLNAAYKTFESQTDEILLFINQNKVCGWIHYYALNDDKYIGLQSFNIESGTEIALKEFEEFCRIKFKGYDLYAGFPEENYQAITYLNENEYELLETSFPAVFHFDNKTIFEDCPIIEKIGKENYRKFEMLHRQIDGDMYWNSKRILKTLENWLIFYLEDDNTQGAIYINYSHGLHEIFGIDFDKNEFNFNVFSKLLKKCLAYLSAHNARHLYYFAEENEINYLLDLGFENLGIYRCYKKKIA